MHRFLLHNGRIRETAEKVLSPGQVGLLNGWGVFSTIRVFDGVLFAFERHWARMRRDASLLRVPFPQGSAALHADLISLVEANQAANATLRVCVIRNRGGMFEGEGIDRDYDVIAFTAGMHDWGKGVNLAVQPQARHAGCPLTATKMLSWSFNLTWLEAARDRGLDEVLLLNEHGLVSECTSANIFIAVSNGVLTPPLSAGCLPGITRELLLGEARPSDIPVHEKDLRLEDFYDADAVFITSTTRQLLPVFSIEGKPVNQRGDLRDRLQAAFCAYVDRYVRMAQQRGDAARLATGQRG